MDPGPRILFRIPSCALLPHPLLLVSHTAACQENRMTHFAFSCYDLSDFASGSVVVGFGADAVPVTDVLD